MLVYIAVPYTHKDPAVQKFRFHKVNQIAATLMRAGYHVYSPISHTHPIAMDGALPTDWGFWEKYDEVMIEKCDALMVLTLDGWKESRGVTAELEIARRLGKTIMLINDKAEIVTNQ